MELDPSWEWQVLEQGGNQPSVLRLNVIGTASGSKVARKLELDQTVYKNLVSILIRWLLDVYDLKFIIQWFFFVCVLCML